MLKVSGLVRFFLLVVFVRASVAVDISLSDSSCVSAIGSLWWVVVLLGRSELIEAIGSDSLSSCLVAAV